MLTAPVGQSAGDRTDPRITRTAQAFEQAIVELAAQRPVSQITVADLADRAGVTRATFYNRYSSPLELLIQVLYADLERVHRLEDARRAEGRYSAEQMLRLATGDVADHVERFMAVYRHALHDPADGGVYEALVRHFTDYSMAFIARSTHPDLPRRQPSGHGAVRRPRVRRSHQGLAQRRLGDQNGPGRGRRGLRARLVELTLGGTRRCGKVNATLPSKGVS